MKPIANLPPLVVIDPCLKTWLSEDIGRGDRTTQALFSQPWPAAPELTITANIVLKQAGVIAGLPLAQRIFQLLSDQVSFLPAVVEGEYCPSGTIAAQLKGPTTALLTGERVALNLIMHLSGIASLTRTYTEQIDGLPTQLVDTRKTTPGLRVLEKYATQVGGAINHRMGLDDAIMIKDNHIVGMGSLGAAIAQARNSKPMPMPIEVETESLEQVHEALAYDVDIIMLDNMPLEQMREAVSVIRTHSPHVKIEASGNINLSTLRPVAETGVDYISTSAPITQSSWLDVSLQFTPSPSTNDIHG